MEQWGGAICVECIKIFYREQLYALELRRGIYGSLYLEVNNVDSEIISPSKEIDENMLKQLFFKEKAFSKFKLKAQTQKILYETAFIEGKIAEMTKFHLSQIHSIP